MINDMTDCGGCRTCEMACAFHHTGMFSFKDSSIRILDKGNEKGYLVELLGSCDYCLNEKIPLCVQYCNHKDFLMEILSKFVNKKNKDSMEA